MRAIANFLFSLMIAAWIGCIAIFSVQNFDPAVSIKFLFFESVRLPIGVLLAFCAGGGVMLGGIIPLLLPRPRRGGRRPAQSQEADEFDF
ncbi:MAG: DUF1049 domain-containing protein [Chloroflexaceae bacterium]|nr:DUF1049 domain-containing protein [Chloroflexaceae bacterium]